METEDPKYYEKDVEVQCRHCIYFDTPGVRSISKGYVYWGVCDESPDRPWVSIEDSCDEGEYDADYLEYLRELEKEPGEPEDVQDR